VTTTTKTTMINYSMANARRATYTWPVL